MLKTAYSIVWCNNTDTWFGRTGIGLTAVAGGSFVSCVGAVAVEGIPRLRAFPSMFTIAGRAPARQTEAYRLLLLTRLDISCGHEEMQKDRQTHDSHSSLKAVPKALFIPFVIQNSQAS